MELFRPSTPKSDFYLSIINTPQRPYLKWLCDGTKTAEGRVFHHKCKEMQVGGTIVLEDKNRNQWIFGHIKFLHVYASFKEMLEREGVENMLPFLSPEDIDGGVRIYESFPRSERVLTEGCVAIGSEGVENNFGEKIKN